MLPGAAAAGAGTGADAVPLAPAGDRCSKTRVSVSAYARKWVSKGTDVVVSQRNTRDVKAPTASTPAAVEVVIKRSDPSAWECHAP